MIDVRVTRRKLIDTAKRTSQYQGQGRRLLEEKPLSFCRHKVFYIDMLDLAQLDQKLDLFLGNSLDFPMKIC